MRTGRMLWVTYAVLGALVYAESAGYWSHAGYRLALVSAVLSWAGWVVWTPKAREV